MPFRPRLTHATPDGLPVVTDVDAPAIGTVIAFTARAGGASEPPYDTLNLSATVGDEDELVARNRAKLTAALGLDAGDLALARQVHAADVIEVTAERGVVGAADALVTRSPGAAVGVLTADCAPVVIAGDEGVAVAHAGWRGLVAGVVQAAAATIGRPRAAWIGPSIHACCYEVGPEVIVAFRAAGLPVAGSDRVDPGRAATVALRRAGVERVAMSDVCTSCDRGYFSFRRDGLTGRQGGFAALVSR